MKKSKNLITNNLIVFFVFLLILAIGITYAWWALTLKGTKTNILKIVEQ